MQQMKSMRLVLLVAAGMASGAGSQTLTESLIRDSLFLDIPVIEAENVPFSVDSVSDDRGVPDPRLVAVDEVSKYFYVPVDRFIITGRPLAALIQDRFQSGSDHSDAHIRLGLDHFRLQRSTVALFFKHVRLNAAVSLHSGPDRSVPERTLVFDKGITRFFIGNPMKKGYETVLRSWLGDIPGAVCSADAYIRSGSGCPPAGLVPAETGSSWMRLNMTGDLIATPEETIMDGRIFFSYPETALWTTRFDGLLRFRSGKKRDSVEWGIVNVSAARRLNRDWRLLFRTHLLLGLNRWKDMKTADHELYDALIGDFCLVQGLGYQPLHARSLLFGAGFYQGMTVIYSEGIRFQFGLVVHTGVTL
ncbi:hypothetical protein JW948_16230 [bacterium]|nr:hypothetical protein [bacterium]